MKRGRKPKKAPTTFKQEGLTFQRCPCGADKIATIPSGRENNYQMYQVMCEGCGEIVSKRSEYRTLGLFQTAWNAHMTDYQERLATAREEDPDDPTGDEEA